TPRAMAVWVFPVPVGPSVVAGLPLIQGPDGNDPPSNESSTPNSRPKGLEVEDLAGGWKSERDSRLVSGPLLYPRHCQGARHLSEYGAQVPAQPRTAAEQAAAAPAVEAGPVPGVYQTAHAGRRCLQQPGLALRTPGHGLRRRSNDSQGLHEAPPSAAPGAGHGA